MTSPPPAQPSAETPAGPMQAGLFNEPEPLPGSVRLGGLHAARVVVPLDDGSVLRARVDITDDSVDVALRASAETGLAAEQRVGAHLRPGRL